MNKNLPLEARNAAGGYFRQGYNCAEAVLRAFIDLLPVKFGPEVARLASVFGGGMGRSGCSCGALAGSQLVLGMLAGRDNLERKLDDTYQLAGELHDRFSEKFGGTCCRVLNPTGDFQSQEHLRACLKITGGAAMLLAEFLIEKDLGADFNY
jgi:C_GCAxxG_C_C family probable redox protein